MERRSTNELAGFIHFGGDITGHVESSHGVRLTGGSTGGIVEAVGDDTNVTLSLRGQGAGGVVLGNDSQAVTLAGSSLASTSPTLFSGIRFRVVGASSIVLSPTSTAGITIGNSSNETAVIVTASTMSIAGTSMTMSIPTLITATKFIVQGASSIVLSPTSTAGITIGNSTNENPILITGSSVAVTSTHINLNSTRVVVGSTGASLTVANSTSPFKGLNRGNSTTRPPELASLGLDFSTMTMPTGTDTSGFLLINQMSSLSTAYRVSNVFMSSAAEAKITYANGIASSQSSTEITVQWTYFRF